MRDGRQHLVFSAMLGWYAGLVIFVMRITGISRWVVDKHTLTPLGKVISVARNATHCISTFANTL